MNGYSKKLHPLLSRRNLGIPTLSETNIAMENPPFWWYLPRKIEIFMGYVSFRESNFENIPIPVRSMGRLYIYQHEWLFFCGKCRKMNGKCNIHRSHKTWNLWSEKFPREELQYIYIYTWTFQVSNMCAFSPKKHQKAEIFKYLEDPGTFTYSI